ncbi:hypothetical protein AB5I41_18440 [Sphingomonas sp. MMS24-JH45]
MIGLVGAIVATWRARGTPRLLGWACVALFGAFAALMLLWQARAGPAAQLLAIPGAAALAWLALPALLAALVAGEGSPRRWRCSSSCRGNGRVSRWAGSGSTRRAIIRSASTATTGRCLTLPAMRPLNLLPAQTVFTFVDLGPRLITLTHHDAIAGPYHRNGDAILDVAHAFERSPEAARAIMKAHGATPLLLICPNVANRPITARGRRRVSMAGWRRGRRSPGWSRWRSTRDRRSGRSRSGDLRFLLPGERGCQVGRPT